MELQMEIQELEFFLNSSRTTYVKHRETSKFMKPIKLAPSSRKESCIECISHTKNMQGYTQLRSRKDRLSKRETLLHRFVYFLVNPDIEPLRETVIRHTCDNPFCCNPKHLIHGTARDNQKDRLKRGNSKYSVFSTRYAEGTITVKKNSPQKGI